MDGRDNPAREPRRTFWSELEARLDFARSRPRLRPGYEQAAFTDRSNQEYYVLKSAGGTGYIKLGPRDLFLFLLIDGQRTVQQILAEYFRKHGTLAFSRLGTLVRELLQAGFLAEDPTRFYQRLQSRLQPGKAVSRAVEFIKSLPRRQWPIPDFDAKVEWLYRGGLRLFFMGPVQLLAAAVSLAGLTAFLLTLHRGGFALVSSSGSVVLGLGLLVILNYAAIISHELAHALACKHYGRKVNGGGTMLYLGLPAFYVDITDAWMLPKSKRIMVSAVGSFAQLFLAGVSAGVAWAAPDFALSPLFFKFSVLSYLSIFLNLNPFLELDGYYILIDWLETPGLKEKAKAFVRRELFPRLRSGAQLSPEEKVYTAFGLGGLAWSALALAIVGFSWRAKLVQWTQGFMAFTSHRTRLLLLAAVVAGLLALAVFSRRRLGKLAARAWKRFTESVNNKPAPTAAALVVGCLAAAYGLAWVPGLPGAMMAGLLLLGTGLLYHRVYSYYRGSNLWLVLAGLMAVSAASLGKKFLPPAGDRVLTLAGSAVLFVASYLQFSLSSLRRWRGWQRWLWGGLWMGLMVAAGLIPHTSPWLMLSALFSLSALLMLLSPVWMNQGSSLEYFWYSFLLQTLAWNAILFSGQTRFAMLTALLGFFSLLWLYLVLKSARWLPEAAVFEHADSERRRLRRAAVRIYTSGRRYFAAFFGEAQARAMDDRLNLIMIEKGWPIRLYGGGSEERFERPAGIVERGQAFRGMLDEIHGYAVREAGAYFARNTFRASYESLYWEEREIAQEYLMPGSDWARGLLIADLKREKSDAQNVVASVARFWELTDEEAATFSARLKEERKHAGEVVIRQGDEGDRFYIIKSGSVEISIGDGRQGKTVLALLSKGDYFGEIALVKKVPRTASATALTECSLLVLGKGDFEMMMAQRINIAVKIDRLIENRGFLARLPLFSEFAPAQIAMAASRLVPERHQSGQDIVTQGEVGDSFYIIREGALEVTVEREGQRKRVAELGPGEYFGEIALLLDVPRTASVTAIRDSLVLRLRKDDFQSLMGEHLYFAKSLEQASSRRISDTRHKTVR